MIPLARTLEHTPGWEAELALEFACLDTSTHLSACRHRGPLRLQKPLYPEGKAACQTILLHPPSGIGGGDHSHIAARVDYPEAQPNLAGFNLFLPTVSDWRQASLAGSILLRI